MSGNNNNNTNGGGGYNNTWRQSGGIRDQQDSVTFGEVITDKITIRQGIVGDLAIDGTIYADNLVISGTTLVDADMQLGKNLGVHGHTQTQTLGVSGIVSTLDDVHMAKKLRIGGTVSASAAAAATTTSTQYLWSDGVSGIAVNADFTGSGSVPASLFVAGNNPRAFAATTNAIQTRNILAQTGTPAKSGLAVESGGVTTIVGGGGAVVANPAANTGFTELQFYAGGSNSQQHVDLGGGGADSNLNSGRVRFQDHTLTAHARRIVLAGGASGAAVVGSADGAPDATAASDAAALEVRARPRIGSNAPYNEPWLAGRTRTGTSLLFADAPLRATPADDNDESAAQVFAYLGSANRGWRAAGGGAALDDRRRDDDPAASSSTYLTQADPTRLPALGPNMIDNPSQQRSQNKRSASHAGFLEPGLGVSGMAQFVPVLSQTQGPSRLQNRGTVAINAPLARAHNQAAALINGPTHIQMLDVAPLSLATPFVNLGTDGARAAWDTTTLPDDMYYNNYSSSAMPSFPPGTLDVNGQFGLVLGGRSESSGGFPVYRTIDGGQTWTAGTIVTNTVPNNAQFSATIFGPRHALAYTTIGGFAFVTSDGGNIWANVGTAFNGGGPDIATSPTFAYAVPGRNRLYFTRGQSLYHTNNFTTANSTSTFVANTNTLPITGGLVGTVLDYQTNNDAPATALVAFSGTSNKLRTFVFETGFATGTPPVVVLSYEPLIGSTIDDAVFFTGAASTLAGGRCAKDVVIAGALNDHLVVLLSNPNEAATTITEVVNDWKRANTTSFWTPVVVNNTAHGFKPRHATWIHPQVIVLAGDEGALAVSTDRGLNWRFVGLDTDYHGIIARSGLAAALGPLATLPRICGIFRSAALPHTGRHRRGGPLPPLVLVAGKNNTAAAAFALSLDSLAPRYTPLLQVDGSAAVEGCMDVEQTLDVAGDARVQQRFFANSIDVLDQNAELRIGCDDTYAANISPPPTKTLRIGRLNDTIVFQGSVRQEGAVTLSNKTVTVNNENISSNSGGVAGLQVFENGVADAGYLRTSSDRLGWDIRAPGADTVVARIALEDGGGVGSNHDGTVRAAIDSARPLVAIWTSGSSTVFLGAKKDLAADDLLVRDGIQSTSQKQIVNTDLELTTGKTLTASTIGTLGTTQLNAKSIRASDDVFGQAFMGVSGNSSVGLGNSKMPTVFTKNLGTSAFPTENAHVTTLLAQTIGSTVSPVTTMTATVVNARDVAATMFVSAPTVSAQHVSAQRISAQDVDVTNRVSAQHVSAQRISAQDVDVTNRVSAVHVSAQRVSAQDIDVTNIVSAQTVSAVHVSAQRVSAQDIDVTNIMSAQTVSAVHVSAQRVSAQNIDVTNRVSAQNVSAQNIDVTNRVSAQHVSAQTVSAQSVEASNIVSAQTVRGTGTVEVGTGTTSGEGLRGVGNGLFRISGAIHPRYELFGTNATAVTVPQTLMGAGYAGAIGGNILSSDANGDMNYVHLGGNGSNFNVSTAPAHTWYSTNQVTGNSRQLARLMRNGNMQLSETLLAKGVSASNTVSAASFAATGAVAAQSLNIGGAAGTTTTAAITNGNLVVGTIGITGTRRAVFCNQFTTRDMNGTDTSISASLVGNKLTLAGGASTDVLVDCAGRVSANSVSAISVSANSVSARSVLMPGTTITTNSNIGSLQMPGGSVSARFVDATEKMVVGGTSPTTTIITNNRVTVDTAEAKEVTASNRVSATTVDATTVNATTVTATTVNATLDMNTTNVSATNVGTSTLPVITVNARTVNATGTVSANTVIAGSGGVETTGTVSAATVSASTFSGQRYDDIEATIAQFSPVGTVLDYVGASAPRGWAIMNGQTLVGAGNELSPYKALFDIAPMEWRSGFDLILPDLRGRVVIGANINDNNSPITTLTPRTLGISGGAEEVTLTVDQMPMHNHTTGAGESNNMEVYDKAGNQRNSNKIAAVGSSADGTNKIFTASSPGDIWPGRGHYHILSNTGNSQAHPNMQPWYALNKIIKVV